MKDIFLQNVHCHLSIHQNMVAVVKLIQKRDMFLEQAAPDSPAITEVGSSTQREIPEEQASCADLPKEADTLPPRHPVTPNTILCDPIVPQKFYMIADRCSTMPVSK